MEEDEAEERQKGLTLVSECVQETRSSSAQMVTASLLRSRTPGQQNSADESDTVEYDSESEVENIPKDEEETVPIVTDEKGNRISGPSKKSRTGKTSSSKTPRPASVKVETAADSVQKHTATTTIQVHASTSKSKTRASSSKFCTGRAGLFVTSTRSPQSSSSQEEYEPEVKTIPKQQFLTTCTSSSQVAARSMESLRTSRNFLSADERYSEDCRSLESLSSSSETHITSRTHHRSFLTSSEKDVRRIMTSESRSSENLQREESLNAEVRRGLFANTGIERKIPQHLSLPPASGVFSLTSPGGSDRRITILSPHSPAQTPDLLQFTMQSTLKTRRKKAVVLPRLVLPRSDSEVFLE